MSYANQSSGGGGGRGHGRGGKNQVWVEKGVQVSQESVEPVTTDPILIYCPVDLSEYYLKNERMIAEFCRPFDKNLEKAGKTEECAVPRPDKDWMVVSTYASVCTKIGEENAKISSLFRNTRLQPQAALIGHSIYGNSIFYYEVEAIYVSILFAKENPSFTLDKELNLKGYVFYTDNKQASCYLNPQCQKKILNKINKLKEPERGLVLATRTLIDKYFGKGKPQEFDIQHVRREANYAADYLSKFIPPAGKYIVVPRHLAGGGVVSSWIYGSVAPFDATFYYIVNRDANGPSFIHFC